MTDQKELGGLPVLDPSVLVDAVGGDLDTIQEVVAAYSETLPDYLRQLEAVLGEGALSDAERLAHSIAGGAANLGGKRLRREAKAVEQAAGAGDREAACGGLGRVAEQLAALLAALAANPWRR